MASLNELTAYMKRLPACPKGWLVPVPKTHTDRHGHDRRGLPDHLRPRRQDSGHLLGRRPRLLSRSFPKVGQLMDDAKAEVLAFTAPGYAGQRARHLPRQNRSNRLKVHRPGTVATSQSPAVCWRLHSVLE